MRKKEIFILLIVFSSAISLLILSIHLYTYAIQESLGIALMIDANAPDLTLLSPENTAYENSITISYIAIDPHLDSVWYNLTGNNSSLASIIIGATSLSLEPGSYQLILYANDTFGHTNSTGVNFLVIKSQPSLRGETSGSRGSGGSSSQPPRNTSNQTNTNKTMSPEEKFLRVKMRLISLTDLIIQLLIESSSNSPLEVTYEVISDKIIYQESGIIPFTTTIDKKIPLNIQDLQEGTHAIQVTVKQDGLEAYDQESLKIETETPLRIRKRPSLLPLILSILLLLTYLTLLKLQLEKMKEKKKRSLIRRP